MDGVAAGVKGGEKEKWGGLDGWKNLCSHVLQTPLTPTVKHAPAPLSIYTRTHTLTQMHAQKKQDKTKTRATPHSPFSHNHRSARAAFNTFWSSPVRYRGTMPGPS